MPLGVPKEVPHHVLQKILSDKHLDRLASSDVNIQLIIILFYSYILIVVPIVYERIEWKKSSGIEWENPGCNQTTDSKTRKSLNIAYFSENK